MPTLKTTLKVESTDLFPTPVSFTKVNNNTVAGNFSGFNSLVVGNAATTLNLAAIGATGAYVYLESAATNATAIYVGVSPVAETFFVSTAVNPGAPPPPNNLYVIDGTTQAQLDLVRGGVYTFKQLTASNTAHPIEFKLFDPIDPFNEGADFLTGVVVGSPVGGYVKTVFTVPMNAPNQLVYACGIHGGMGAAITVGDGIGATTTNSTIRLEAGDVAFLPLGDLDGLPKLGAITASGTATLNFFVGQRG